VQALSGELKVHPLIAQVLINRGLTEAKRAQSFLKPALEDLANPFLLKDMEKAVLRLEQALRDGERFTIYGDYDVDGTTGSSLLYLFFRELGASVEVYIPHRIQEGYGLNIKALEYLKDKGNHLVVTVDNGISSVTEAQRAKELGLDLIIIDHHQVPPKVPFAMAILNPKQEDCQHPGKELAGVGVAFQLALGLRNHLRKRGFFEGRAEPNLKKYLDLVTLGTIADMVPLTGQNRILVKMGLKVLSESTNVGVRALKEVAGVTGEVTPGQVGFRLGPRINAAGRLDSAKVGFDLLTCSDPALALQLARKLDEANRERQALEEHIIREASDKVKKDILPKKRRSIFVSDPAWHLGVIGIVASRLVERFYLPTIVGVVEGESMRCSARSIAGLDLFETLKSCADHLKKFGGHRQAAGLTLSLEKKKAFEEAFDQAVRAGLSEEQFTPFIRVDAAIEARFIQERLVEELETLAPFGQGNPEPVFWAKEMTVFNCQKVGSDHLKLKFKTGENLLEAIGFGMGTLEISPAASVDCVFSCQFNEWRGNRRIQLRLVDPPRPQSFKKLPSNPPPPWF